MEEAANVYELAAALGHRIVFRRLPPTVLGLSDPANPSVVIVNRTGYAPRDAYTVAHELAEIYVGRSAPGREHERACDRLAAALLLPRAMFEVEARRHRFNLHVLRTVFPLASYEALGNRLVSVFRGLSAAFWEEERFLYCRPAISQRPPPLEAAASLLRRALAKGHACELAETSIIHAWRATTRRPRRVVTVHSDGTVEGFLPLI